MNLNNTSRPVVFSFLAIGLLALITYSNTINTPDLENKLQLLSKQASQLNLQINQSILLHSLEINNNYDQLTELTLKIESIQHDFSLLEDRTKALKNGNIITALNKVTLRLNEKIDSIETFKSNNAIYTSSKLFANKLIHELKSNRSLSPSEKQQLSHLQSIVSSKTLPSTEIAPQHQQNKLLKLLTQHAKLVILYKNKNRALIKNISSNQLFFAIDYLDSVIYQYLIWSDKKTQAIQNIVLMTLFLALLIPLYSVIYPSKPKS